MSRSHEALIELTSDQLELVCGGAGRPEAAGHYGGSRDSWGGGNRGTAARSDGGGRGSVGNDTGYKTGKPTSPVDIACPTFTGAAVVAGGIAAGLPAGVPKGIAGGVAVGAGMAAGRACGGRGGRD